MRVEGGRNRFPECSDLDAADTKDDIRLYMLSTRSSSIFPLHHGFPGSFC